MKIKLLFFLIFISELVVGQSNILTETFGSSATLTSGWISSNTTNGWNGNISSSSNTYTGFSAGANAIFNGTGANGVVHTLTYSNNLSTVGYNTITILWGGRGSSAFNGVVTFEWSSDGVAWNPVSYTYTQAGNVWGLVNSGSRIALPSAAEGIANLRLRWSAT